MARFLIAPCMASGKDLPRLSRLERRVDQYRRPACPNVCKELPHVRVRPRLHSSRAGTARCRRSFGRGPEAGADGHRGLLSVSHHVRCSLRKRVQAATDARRGIHVPRPVRLSQLREEPTLLCRDLRAGGRGRLPGGSLRHLSGLEHGLPGGFASRHASRHRVDPRYARGPGNAHARSTCRTSLRRFRDRDAGLRRKHDRRPGGRLDEYREPGTVFHLQYASLGR